MRPDWLQEGAVPQLLALLSADGEEARVVGGAVRNHLMGLPVADIDIASTCVPEVAQARLQQAGIKVVPTGLDHGTLTAVIDKTPYEITTLREDVATNGRHAVVEFGRDWLRDAQRRDFTFNAMSLDADGVLFDPFGGEADVKARHIRFIGDARERIREDYLRILRFFRFFALYGDGKADEAGLAACVSEKEGLETLSRERIRAEMLKLLAAPHPLPALRLMQDNGILTAIAAPSADLAALARLLAIEEALPLAPDAVMRLAVMWVRDRDDALLLREELRLSNAESRRLEGMAETAVIPHDEAAQKALLYHLGSRNYRDRLLHAFARSGAGAEDAGWRAAFDLPSRWQAPVFPVSGQDLLARGHAEGPELGAALTALRDKWMQAGFPRSKEAVLALQQAEPPLQSP